MNEPFGLVELDPQKLGGVAVFKGTRVPVGTLFEYVEAGDRVDDFLEDYPTVTRPEVIAVLEQAKTELVGLLREDPSR